MVGVWVGFDDGRSVGLSGAGAALPIVARFLARAEPDDPDASFPEPDGIEWASVRGGEASLWTDCGEREVFLRGTAPRGECDRDDRDWRDDRDRDDDREDRMPRIIGRPAMDRLAEILTEALRERRHLEDRVRRFHFKWR